MTFANDKDNDVKKTMKEYFVVSKEIHETLQRKLKSDKILVRNF